MILYIQLLLIIVLVLVLSALYIEERQGKKSTQPMGRITGFWDGSERRRFVRISASTPLRYSLPKETGNINATKTKNISVGGVCITVTEKLNPNTLLSLEIDVAGSSPPILAKGTVAWISEDTLQKDTAGIRYFDVGIEFKEISPKDRERLFNFIKGLEKTGGG